MPRFPLTDLGLSVCPSNRDSSIQSFPRFLSTPFQRGALASPVRTPETATSHQTVFETWSGRASSTTATPSSVRKPGSGCPSAAPRSIPETGLDCLTRVDPHSKVVDVVQDCPSLRTHGRQSAEPGLLCCSLIGIAENL